MFLSLPLPIKKTRKMFVCLVRADPTTDVYKVRGGLEEWEGGREGRVGCHFVMCVHNSFLHAVQSAGA